MKWNTNSAFRRPASIIIIIINTPIFENNDFFFIQYEFMADCSHIENLNFH